MEKISVIMSIYEENEAELRNSIESILNQTYSNIEFIIIVDNPKGKERIDIIKSYNDIRIKLIINEKNLGLPNSLNIGIENATGKYIARMDADDIALNERLEKQYKYLVANKLDLIGGSIQCFIENSNQQLVKYPKTHEFISKLLYVKNCIAHPTWFGKKEVFDVLKYRNIFSCEDYDFLIRAVQNGYQLGNIDDTILKYRLSPKSISRANPGKQELIAEFLRNKYVGNQKFELSEIDTYMNSIYFNNKLNEYNKYCSLKNERAKYRSDKFPKYYLYTIQLLLNLKFSIKEIKRKIYTQYIILLEKKKNDY